MQNQIATLSMQQPGASGTDSAGGTGNQHIFLHRRKRLLFAFSQAGYQFFTDQKANAHSDGNRGLGE